MDQRTANKLLIAIGWICFLAPIIAWPITALTVAKDEPAFVLGLSYLAVVLSGATILLQALVKRDVDS